MVDPDNVINTGFDPEFGGPLAKFRAALTARGIDTNIISGVRSEKLQGELVANRDATLAGRPLPYPRHGKVYVAAPVGGSTHQIGLGADVQPVNPADAATMHKLAQQFGLAMPNWNGRDPYHVQLANWQAAAATQAPPQPWPTLPVTPSQFASNTSAETPSGGGFAIPGTTITVGGGAPIAGALAERGPENSNTGGGTAKPSEPMDTRQLVYNKLTGIGLAPHQALGALYGLGGESRASLDTTASNPDDPGGAIGIGQWTGGSGRRQALEAFARNRGTSVTDPNTQADFLVEELTNPKAATYQPGVLDAMKSANNAADATQAWVAKFERPKVNNWQDRYKQGSAVGSLDSDNNFVVGSARPSNTTVASQAGGARDDIAVPGTQAAANQAAADNQSWFGKFTQGPIDPATGKPDPNAKTPMAQIASAILDNTKNTQDKVAAAGPEKTALSDQPAPLARNVSPMGGALLPNVGQTYGQTLNSFSRPLAWNAMPPQGSQMAAAGFQGGFGPQAPGVSLNSLPALPLSFPGQIRPLTLDEYGYQGAGYAS